LEQVTPKESMKNNSAVLDEMDYTKKKKEKVVYEKT
jgi:hypothetical protein